jgi:hypothetical protein
LKYIWKYIIAIAIGVLIGWWLFRGGSNREYITTTTTIDTVYQDTGSHTVEYIPKPIYINSTDTLWKTEYIDTTKVIQDYYTVRGYDSTIVDDSSMYIHYTEVISRNKSQGIKFVYKNKVPTLISSTTTVAKPSPKLYVSAIVGGNLSHFDYGVGVSYHIGRTSVYGSYLIPSKTVLVGLGFKVK